MIEKNGFCKDFISYELVMTNETEDSPSFIALNDLQLSIQTNDSFSTAVYHMKIRVRNTHSTIIYSDFPFRLWVMCNLNFTAPSITAFKYQTGSFGSINLGSLIYQSRCSNFEITYASTLENGKSLPRFINFNKRTKTY